MQSRPVKPLAALALVIALSPQAAAGHDRPDFEWTRTDPAFERTCTHYENRARFLPRVRGTAFEATLADACRAALDTLESGRVASPYEGKRAWLFLKRLTALKRAVIEMNMARMFGPDPAPFDQIKRPATRLNAPSAVRPVNRFSEYLIAREMGVVRRLNDWARASDFPVLALR
ncbi:hypothetical protein [Roseovarius salinarum]|uniref:hypothetical protein n=1 Tax=Roseovarius salinarum TaxID=1981892 RepID=UPI001E5647D4|nr:hypothetical protein [Roseovarius salinarum]